MNLRRLCSVSVVLLTGTACVAGTGNLPAQQARKVPAPVPVPIAPAEEAKPSAQPKVEKKPKTWFIEREMQITPMAAPDPALRFRLFPLVSERKEGNCVPLYLRLAWERPESIKRMVRDQASDWADLPFAQFPVADAKKLLESFRSALRQMELGAHRKDAEWNYALDDGAIEVLLPDVQELRAYCNLQAVKARVEIAEGRYADAIHTLETGYSFSQQMSAAPFLITSIVGSFCTNVCSTVVTDLIEQPGAPNLYWALTALPRPFIDLRKPLEVEQRIAELEIPEFSQIDKPRSVPEWDALLRKIRRKELKLVELESEKVLKGLPANAGVNDAADQSPDLPAARKYLTEKGGFSADAVEAMPAAQVLLVYIHRYTCECRDEYFKGTYLPFPQARLVLEMAEQRNLLSVDTEGRRIARPLLAALGKVLRNVNRTERILAVLRVMEALRMHAAANNRRLPEKLEQVTIVPIPNDPGTDRPFEYQSDGTTATIISRLPGVSTEMAGLRFRVTLRK